MRVKGNVQPLSSCGAVRGLQWAQLIVYSLALCPALPLSAPGPSIFSESAFPGGAPGTLPKEALGKAVGAWGGAPPSTDPWREGTHAGDTELGGAGPEHLPRPLFLVHIGKQGIQPGRASMCACMCAWAHVCVHAHGCMCTCARVHACSRACAHRCACTCLYTWVHVHTCVCVHVCICAPGHMCAVHVCTHGVCAYVCAHVHVCMCVCMHACA